MVPESPSLQIFNHMKIVFQYIVALILFTFCACDIIEPPYMIQQSQPDTIQQVLQQHVLVEYFTGHRCPNCPTEAAQLKQFQSLYGNRFIFISVHAGPFAAPAQPNYTIDYRTQTGNELDQHFQVTAISTPNALINRTVYNNSRVIPPSSWASVIAQELNKTPQMDISLHISQNQQQFQVTSIIRSLQQFNDPHYITIYIAEDSLQSYQKNNNPQIGPTPDIPDYYHRYVLRGSLNGTFGEKLFNTASQNDTFQVVKIFSPEQNWNVEKLYIICFVYNEATGEIVQTAQKKIK